MATSDAPQPSQSPPPSADQPSSKSQHHPDFYDTQFIVGRLKGEQRKSRLRFYLLVAALAGGIAGLYTLTARRAEAPKTLQTQPVVIPAQKRPAPPETHPKKPVKKEGH